jgi:hypothetical protein
MPVYVQHQVLGNIDDVFDAEAIWRAPGLALFSRRPLLRDLLERSPREQRGRAPVRCFSHVSITLPQEAVDDDRHLTRGARARDLAQMLRELHQKDFGDLLGDEDVRYDIHGDEALQPGEIEVRFGHAVYLPAPEEQVLYHVTASLDGASWHQVCPIHMYQRLAVLGAEGESVSHAVPQWPFGPVGALVLINDGPDAPLEIQVRPRHALDCRYDPLHGCHVVRLHGDGGPRLLLRVHKHGVPVNAGAPAASAGVWKLRPQPGQEHPASDATAVPPPAARAATATVEQDATYAPVMKQTATLVALALPRLSRYRETGAARLDLAFDRTLNLGTHDPVIRFQVNEADCVSVVTADGEQVIHGLATFAPTGGKKIALTPAPAPMADRYCALLSLPEPRVAAIAGGAPLTFGRASPALAQLRLLDAPGFLQSAEGVLQGADRLGLSRQAFSVQAAEGGYAVVRLAPTQALFHLDANLRFVAAITMATAEQPYRLPAGHHLVAGHYVLRFDA